MKRFSKVMSLLTAAVILTASTSITADATTVSSVVQSEASVELESVEGVADGTEVIISIPENILSDLSHTGEADSHSAEMTEAVQAATADNAAQAFAGGLSAVASELGVNENYLQFASVFNVYVQDHVDGDPVTITLKTQYAAGTPYILAHYYDGGWNVNSYGTVGTDGKVTFTANRFSPFAILTVSDTSNVVKASPQTGEDMNAFLVMALALAAVAAVVAVSGKKKIR